MNIIRLQRPSLHNLKVQRIALSQLVVARIAGSGDLSFQQAQNSEPEVFIFMSAHTKGNANEALEI